MPEDIQSQANQDDRLDIPDPLAGAYQVSISGPGITVDKSVDVTVALQIVSTIMNPISPGLASRPAEATVPSPRPTTASAFTPQEDVVSVGEYLEGLEARRNPDKIVAIGLYIRDYQGNNTFVKDDLKKYFQQAGETPPANLNRDVRATLSAKWIAPATDPDAEPNTYWVTKKGAQAAANHFPDEKPPTRKSARRRVSKINGSEE